MRKTDVTQWDIAVLGAGTMGLSIAQLFAMNHHNVYLYNRTPANLEKALKQIESNLHTLTDLGLFEEKDIPAAMDRIQGTSNLKSAAASADYIYGSRSRPAY